MAKNAIGKISQVIGAVVDVEFDGNLPAIQNALEVDNNGRDVKDVAKEWLAKNESVWRGWIKAAM